MGGAGATHQLSDTYLTPYQPQSQVKFNQGVTTTDDNGADQPILTPSDDGYQTAKNRWKVCDSLAEKKASTYYLTGHCLTHLSDTSPRKGYQRGPVVMALFMQLQQPEPAFSSRGGILQHHIAVAEPEPDFF